MDKEHVRRSLRKRDVEILMDNYDALPIESLMVALSTLVGRQLDTWDDAVAMVPCPPAMREALLRRETGGLDALVKQLVEKRSLEQ